ncbi:MAG: WYL domain-containing protein [Clostridium sp.]|nr:WYL domain-containing protein [Clostridium sp.]MDY3828794.1 WYL domain-containing protein [Clostridium sp.]
MSSKQSKNSRTLDMYARLCEGKVINKLEESQRFGVDERSIQRDIDDIRAFLDNRLTEYKTIEYDRNKKGFVMTYSEGSDMTNSEILAVTKILLESRAFTKKELNEILNKMVKGCVPLKNMKLVSELIANERYHYVELHHKSMLQDKMWELGENIKEHNLLEIKYTKANAVEESIKRIIEPVGIIFSEYYFYLNAYIDIQDENGKYVHKYDYPAIFRLDRIKSYKRTGEKFQIPYASRFEEGEFRKRVQFMYAGKLMNIQLKYYGANPEPILDRLPTAKIIKQDKEETLIEAEVYGKGIVMWLLSQGSNIEVIKPDSLRQEMKQKLLEMLDRY